MISGAGAGHGAGVGAGAGAGHGLEVGGNNARIMFGMVTEGCGHGFGS